MSTLQKSFDWKALLALGLGCVVGWSWVIYSGMWGSLGGTMGGVLAFVIVAILCSFVGLVYAELSSTYHKAGGEVIFSIEDLGLGWARVAQWMCLLSWVGLLAVEAIGIPVILTTIGFTVPQVVPLYQFAGETVYLSYILVSIGINGIFAVINILGASISGTVQKWAVYLLLAAAVFFCVSGIALGEPANMEPLFTTPQAVFTVLLMLPGFMSGFNAIPQAAEEGKVPHKMVGRVVIITIWAAAIFYLMIVLGLGFAAPLEVRSGAGLAVLDAVTVLFNGSIVARTFVAIAALLGMLTTWNSAYVAGSRLLVGLGRAKFLPGIFSDIHPKFNTPYKSILFLFILGSLMVFMGANMTIFGILADALSLNVVLEWVLTSVCFLRLQKIRPDLPRPYRVKHPKLIGWISLLCCLAFTCLYLPFSPSGLMPIEWGVLAVYVIFALIIDQVWNRKNKSSLEERRQLLGLNDIETE